MSPRTVKQIDTALNRRIGDAVRAARLSRGVTQEDLAKMLGVDRVTVARYESGLRTLTAPTLFTIFEYLEVPLSSLWEVETKQAPASTPSFAPPLQHIVALLQQRPDLAISVQELLDTMLEE